MGDLEPRVVTAQIDYNRSELYARRLFASATNKQRGLTHSSVVVDVAAYVRRMRPVSTYEKLRESADKELLDAILFNENRVKLTYTLPTFSSVRTMDGYLRILPIFLSCSFINKVLYRNLDRYSLYETSVDYLSFYISTSCKHFS